MEKGPEPSLFERWRLAFSFYSITIFGYDKKTRPHWNQIAEGVILGAMPIQTEIWGHGNHGHKILSQCETKGHPLGLVISANEQWELDGFGFMGLTPVPSEFWSAHQVIHRRLDFKDFGDNVPVEQLKAEVEAIKATVAQGKTSYIHCKAGRGRSVVIVLCYLMDALDLSPREAFELLIRQRPHIAPSMTQFALIELYRQTYCEHLAPLEIHDPIYMPYRKDFVGYVHSPTLHGALATISILLAWEVSVPAVIFATLGGTTTLAISTRMQTPTPLLSLEYPEAAPTTTAVVAEQEVSSDEEATPWLGWLWNQPDDSEPNMEAPSKEETSHSPKFTRR